MIESTAAKIWHSLLGFYTKTFYPAFLKYFVHNKDTFWALIAIVVVLAVVSSIPYIKSRPIWMKIIGNLCAVLVVLTCIVGFLRFTPDLFKFESTSNNSKTTSTKNTTPTENTAKTTPQTTTPQTTKQLWYTVGCSSCWADGCNHNGYYYNGQSDYYYNYYRNVCQSCSCNDYKAQSYWR